MDPPDHPLSTSGRAHLHTRPLARLEPWSFVEPTISSPLRGRHVYSLRASPSRYDRLIPTPRVDNDRRFWVGVAISSPATRSRSAAVVVQARSAAPCGALAFWTIDRARRLEQIRRPDLSYAPRQRGIAEYERARRVVHDLRVAVFVPTVNRSAPRPDAQRSSRGEFAAASRPVVLATAVDEVCLRWLRVATSRLRRKLPNSAPPNRSVEPSTPGLVANRDPAVSTIRRSIVGPQRRRHLTSRASTMLGAPLARRMRSLRSCVVATLPLSSFPFCRSAHFGFAVSNRFRARGTLC